MNFLDVDFLSGQVECGKFVMLLVCQDARYAGASAAFGWALGGLGPCISPSLPHSLPLL